MEISPSLIVYIILLVFMAFSSLWLRNRQEKIATTHVRVELLRESGQSQFFLIREDNGFIDLTLCGAPEGKSGDGNTDYASFPINGLCTTEVPFPEGWPPFLRTRIKKIIVWAGSWVPVTYRGYDPEGLLSPQLLAGMRREKFSALTVQWSETVQDLEDRLQKALSRQMKPATVYLMLGLTIALAGVAAYAGLVGAGILAIPSVVPVPGG